MELTVQRDTFTSRSTIGRLLIGTKFECDTLEDVVRVGPKVQNATAIPEGRYQVITNWSARFKRIMPLLLEVPGFDGIRIHQGNTDLDTDGCILLGQRGLKPDWISNSCTSFGAFFILLEGALRTEKVYLTVTHG